MKREQLQEKFHQLVERSRHGKAGERHAAKTQIEGMVEEYPWLRDYARLLGLTDFPGLTREFPWLAPPASATAAKTRHAKPTGRIARGAAASLVRPRHESCATETWVKPPLPAGFEYRQCYKPNCKCMKGGAWHGPYRYTKLRDGATVHSLYMKTTDAERVD
jgi:hypothetical protein